MARPTPMCKQHSDRPGAVLGVIPARRHSSRFPGKHLTPLLGKPMIAYAIEAALQSVLVDRLVISSDDPELARLARDYGVEFVERPSELAQDTSAFEDSLRQVCDTLLERDRYQPELILAMQANVPIRKEGQADELIRRFEELPAATALCTAQHIRLRPEWAKVLVDDATGECSPYSLVDRGFRQQDHPPLFLLDGAICGVRRETLCATRGNLATHAWLGDHLHLLVQDDPMYSLEIDYPNQVSLAEYYLDRLSDQESIRAQTLSLPPGA